MKLKNQGKKENEDIILERNRLENDKKDIKIAFDRIQSTFNNLNEERRKIDLEKINTLKKLQELENRKAILLKQKQKLNFQKMNNDRQVEAIDKLKFSYTGGIYNFNGKINQNPPSKTYNNFHKDNNTKKFNAEYYMNNLMNSLNNKQNLLLN